MSIDVPANNIDEQSRKRERRGKFFGKNQSFRGGNVEIGSLSLRGGELTFLTIALGLIGQIYTETSGTPSTGSDPIMTMNALGGDIQTIGDISPAVDDTYLCGHADRAWQFVISQNAFVNISDRRTKKNIKKLTKGLAEVLKLQPVTYNKRSEKVKRKQIGFIAQDVKKILPEVVYGSGKEPYGVAYEAIVPVLVNAIQELSAKVNRLEKQLKK